jgi:hypothetical protein
MTAEPCEWCGTPNNARHRRTWKHRGAFIARLFWTHNAVVKDDAGTVHVVGRSYRDQEPRLPL